MIGVFDSGVGGLSVWREIIRHVPDTPTVYLADQAHIPYGGRALDEVRALTVRAAGWLIERGCSLIVVACNTASAAALEALRATFPDTPFVGMEPAVKPAAQYTHTGVVGVLATPTTLRSPRYADLVLRWGRHLRIIEQPCPGWVEAVERLALRADGVGDAALSHLVDARLMPLLEQRADVFVLGCTHFPFLRPWIERSIGAWQASQPNGHTVTIIDPAPAVARRARQVQLERVSTSADGLTAPRHTAGDAAHEFWTTGPADGFARVVSNLLGQAVSAQSLVL